MTMAQRPENNKIRQMLIFIPLAFVLIFIPFG
jgi:hypothetical protein